MPQMNKLSWCKIKQMRGRANRMIGDNIEDSTLFVLEFSSQRQMQARVQHHPELSEHNKRASRAEETLTHVYIQANAPAFVIHKWQCVYSLHLKNLNMCTCLLVCWWVFVFALFWTALQLEHGGYEHRVVNESFILVRSHLCSTYLFFPERLQRPDQLLSSKMKLKQEKRKHHLSS